MTKINEWAHILKSEYREHIESRHPGIAVLRFVIWFHVFLLFVHLWLLIVTVGDGETGMVLPSLVLVVITIVALTAFRKWRMDRHFRLDLARDANYWTNRLR